MPTPWLHGTISRAETEELVLKPQVVDGTFLVRQRGEREGEYILCVVFRGQATHHLIKPNGDGVLTVNNQDYGGATNLEQLINIFTKPVEKWPVVLNPPVVDYRQLDHGHIQRKDAEDRVYLFTSTLGLPRNDGVWFVRHRSEKEDEFIFVVGFQGKVTHHLVARSPDAGTFAVNGKPTDAQTVNQVIRFLQTKPSFFPVGLDYPITTDWTPESSGAAMPTATITAPVAVTTQPTASVEPNRPQVAQSPAAEEEAPPPRPPKNAAPAPAAVEEQSVPAPAPTEPAAEPAAVLPQYSVDDEVARQRVLDTETKTPINKNGDSPAQSPNSRRDHTLDGVTKDTSEVDRPAVSLAHHVTASETDDQEEVATRHAPPPEEERLPVDQPIPDPRLPTTAEDYNYFIGTCPRIVAELFRDDKSISWGFGINSNRPPVVTGVENGSVAYDAGVYPGDVIVAIEGHDTINVPFKQTLMKLKAADTQLVLELLRPSLIFRQDFRSSESYRRLSLGADSTLVRGAHMSDPDMSGSEPFFADE